MSGSLWSDSVVHAGAVFLIRGYNLNGGNVGWMGGVCRDIFKRSGGGSEDKVPGFCRILIYAYFHTDKFIDLIRKRNKRFSEFQGNILTFFDSAFEFERNNMFNHNI